MLIGDDQLLADLVRDKALGGLMKTVFYSKVLTSLALLSISVPLAFADDHDRQHGDKDYEHQRMAERSNFDHDHDRQHGDKDYDKYQHPNPNWNNNNWKWEEHNWNEQREQMRANWQRHHERQMSAQQRQQLDAQMRAQWLRYHNNSWNGPSGWDQYNDPRFLDYLHNTNPSLLSTIRSHLGF